VASLTHLQTVVHVLVDSRLGVWVPGPIYFLSHTLRFAFANHPNFPRAKYSEEFMHNITVAVQEYSLRTHIQKKQGCLPGYSPYWFGVTFQGFDCQDCNLGKLYACMLPDDNYTDFLGGFANDNYSCIIKNPLYGNACSCPPGTTSWLVPNTVVDECGDGNSTICYLTY